MHAMLKRVAVPEGPAFGRVLHLGPDANWRFGSVNRRQACLARFGSRGLREPGPARTALRGGRRVGRTPGGNGSKPETSSDGLGRCRASLRTDQRHRLPEAFGPWRPGNGRFWEQRTSGCNVPESGRIHGPAAFGSRFSKTEPSGTALANRTVQAETSAEGSVAARQGRTPHAFGRGT